MLGLGYYVGAGIQIVGGVTDGPLPTGVSSETYAHIEVNVAEGVNGGGSVDLNGDGVAVGGGTRWGVGAGAMGGAGATKSGTAATPTLGEIFGL